MPQLPSDFEIKGLKSLQRKLLRPREFLREYDEIIREELQNGIIEQITENNNPSLDGGSIQYSLLAIVRSHHDSRKLRVVYIYDGFTKTPDREYSMNDCQEIGPNFTLYPPEV